MTFLSCFARLMIGRLLNGAPMAKVPGHQQYPLQHLVDARPRETRNGVAERARDQIGVIAQGQTILPNDEHVRGARRLAVFTLGVAIGDAISGSRKRASKDRDFRNAMAVLRQDYRATSFDIRSDAPLPSISAVKKRTND